ncbi:RNA-editing complex protein nuclease krepb1, putative [Bodo saltans]|uniref:RNA-editing complex protein nuclease krepb1, putative n=1 Tax=Bodo saltans TaxID=75058 RepID=A0A0S4JEQ5_BODSA|nr:RNA-editing complex protein nuclease krepb1, putative [Bodo saltans]|eukprot:CUG90070.1 RNA-editing complex protein nuclease krepb1, putative [Bodo saltans]
MAMPARHFITPLAIVASRVRAPSSQPLLPVIGLMFLSRTIVHRQRFQATQRRRGGGGGDNNGGCSSDAPGAIQGPVPTNFPTLTFGSGTSLLPAGEEGGVGHGGTMRTLKASDAEDFYFKGQQSLVTEDVSPAQMHHQYHNNNGRAPPSGQQQTYFCRLCQEDVVPPFTPRAHILASSRTTHTNHSCRETVLDTLAVVLARGYSIDKMALTWARLLFHHPRDAFPRIGALSDPTWSLAKRGEKLLELLKLLTDVGVIDIAYAAIAPEDPAQQSAAHRRRIAMERTECIGDNSWGHHMSHRMITLFPDRQFLFSQFASRFREALQLGLADDSPLLGVDDDELYFRDPYFNLTTTPSYNNAVVSSAAVGAATIAPTEGSGAEGGGGSDSSIHGDRPLAAAAAAWSIVGVFPRLQDGPTIVHDPTSSTLGGSTQTSSCFDASRLVPSTVKPPVAGVVTEKNLYPGRFLFTALMQHSAAAKAKKNVLIQETAATEGDASAAAAPVDKIVNDVVTDPGHTSDTTAAAVAAPTASSPTEPASGVDSGSSNNAASINDGISSTETILEQLVQQWQQRCSTESDCFPVLMTGLRLHVTPPQQSSQSNVYSEE